MKFTSAVSYLIFVSAAFAIVSTDAILQQSKEVASGSHVVTDTSRLTVQSNRLRRRLEENADEDKDDENNDEADGSEDEDDEKEENDSGDEEENDEEENDEEESDEEENDEEQQSEDVENDGENGEGGDGSDDYTFYDDQAIQNCEEGDENCEKAAAYAAYDDEYLANCEEDDEECNEAAAYMEAKQKQEAEDSTNPWDVKNYTDKYSSMSKTSKIWFIVLAIWFALLGIFTCYLCCCRKGYESKRAAQKPLKESLIGDSSNKSTLPIDGKVSA